MSDTVGHEPGHGDLPGQPPHQAPGPGDNAFSRPDAPDDAPPADQAPPPLAAAGASASRPPARRQPHHSDALHQATDADGRPPAYIEAIRRLQAAERTPGRGAHFAAMMRKNALQKWRSPIGCLFETLLPAIFVVGLIVIWKLTDSEVVPAKQFVTTHEGAPLPNTATMLSQIVCNGGNTAVPMLPYCTDKEDPALKCANSELLVGFPVGARLCQKGALDPGRALYGHLDASMEQPLSLPSLDEWLLAHWAFKGFRPRRLGYATRFRGLSSGGRIFFYPDTTAVKGLVEHMNTTSQLFRYVYGGTEGSYDSIKRRIEAKDFNADADAVFAVIGVHSLANSAEGFKVTLHHNRSGVPWTNGNAEAFANGLGTYFGSQYYWGGFMTTQQLLLEYFGRDIVGLAAADLPPMVVAPFPYTEYDNSDFLTIIGGLAPLFLVFGYLFSVSQLTKRLVEEKESRMREAMMIMGLGNASFYATWLLTYAVMGLGGAVLILILCKTTMLPKSDIGTVFFLFLLFALSTVTLSSLMSAFFSKARIAALVAPVVFFVLAVPSFALPDSTPGPLLMLLSLMSPTAFARGAKLLFEFERTTGANPTTFFQDDGKGYPMAAVFFFLMLDTVLYFLLTVYLDAVLPSDWGTREHPCFCFLRCFGCCCRRHGPGSDQEDGFNSDGSVRDGRDPTGAFEDVKRNTEPSVVMRGLRKEFTTPAGPLTAVSDLTHELHEGEITVLLGHNGAGKTTTINLMTGMLEVTSGDCEVYGHSVKRDVHAARQEIGFCPQHNILWDELTCREHLHFFASLKGFTGNERQLAIDAMLDAVDLRDKADVRSAGLSGGQKRKLSVGIAFVGGSRMVFLDEPTAGMDVAARRFTWDLIKQMSPGRTIVLTTHFMDEADLLGNTVAIMSRGRLKCAGSSMFLKSRLGVGYTLTMATEQGADTSAVAALVREHVPTAQEITNSGAEVSMRLPMEYVPSFPALLRALEDHEGAAATVRSHGVGVTTLEEIFLKIGEEDDGEEEHQRQAADKAREQRKSLVQAVEAGQAAAETLTPHLRSRALWDGENSGSASIWHQPWALLVKRFHNARRDRRTQVLQVLLPVVCILLALLLSLFDFADIPPIRLDHSEYTKPRTMDGIEIALPAAAAAGPCSESLALRAFEKTLVSEAGPAAQFAGTGAGLSQFLLNTAKTHDPAKPRVAAFTCTADAAGPAHGRTWVFNNETGWVHSMPLAVLQRYGMLVRQASGVHEMAFELTTELMPLTENEASLFNSFQALMIGIFIMIPFTFIPSTFVAFIVKERECKAKHLQLVCGLNFAMYWLSNLLFDLASFMLTTVLALVIFLIFDREEYVGDGKTFSATLLLFVLYGLAAVSGSYLISFLFESHASAQNIVMLGNFIMGFLLVLVAYFLSIIKSTKDAGEALTWIFRVWPAFCLGNGIINLAAGGALQAGGTKAFDPFDMKTTGYNMLFMAIEAPIFMCLVLMIDHPTLLKRAQTFAAHEREPEEIDGEDEDVSSERRAVEGGDRGDDIVLVRNLRKLYKTSKGTKLAVRNLSFGVKKGEVFGFLGTNGAGKTTTISMLCGEFLPTAGHMWVAGKDAVVQGGEVRQLLGYCPQFDALLDLLTVDEHLHLYAGLRGLRGDAKTTVPEGLIAACGLEEHRGKETRSLSGGNKRKLSVALALIGAPSVVFLDEPSAGMDPMARRQLWNVIDVVAKQCSVVLTTHHLEEVEALSTRVAIMDQGAMKCLGSLQHLKSKFGSGFEMYVRTGTEDPAATAAAQKFVEDNVPGAALQEMRGGKLTFALPQTAKLSAVFALLHEHQKALDVTDYSVAQTSLESVFLKISEDGRVAQEEAEERGAQQPQGTVSVNLPPQ